MNHLLRSLAPIPSDAWEAIEEEARETLRERLAGRKLVDFKGPLGWQTYAVDLGTTTALGSAPEEGVQARPCRWSSSASPSRCCGPMSRRSPAAPATSSSTAPSRPRASSPTRR